MSFVRRLGWALLERVMPSMSRAQLADQAAVYLASTRAAESELSDEEAKRELQTTTAARPAAVALKLRMLGGSRDSYVSDRAFRLLSAAAEDRPVEPMPPERSELFMRERELGQLPLRDAFAHLKRLEPSLGELELEVAAGRLTAASEHGFSTKEVPLGRTVAHADPLLRSDLALNVAARYLDMLAGSDQSSDLDTPYFAAPRRGGIMSGVLFGSPLPPPRR